MIDFAKARQAMVDSQIHPMGVTSDKILNIFSIVPREEFVPEALKGVCYCDEDIKVAPNRYLMEPSVFARLLEKAKIDENDAVLTIGSGIGYNAAILSHLCGTVVALEEEGALTDAAQEVWNKLDYTNIAAIAGKLSEGAPKYAPYDMIIFNGALSEIPQAIKEQVKVGGKIVAIIRANPMSLAKAQIFHHVKEGQFNEETLFESGTPYLNGFAPEKEFVF